MVQERDDDAVVELIPLPHSGRSEIPRRLTLRFTQKVGRAVPNKARPKADNAIFDSKVLSRTHAEIWEDNGKIYIKDTKSSNGTFVNESRMSLGGVESDPFELKDGDHITFGVDVIENDTASHKCVQVQIHFINNKEPDPLPYEDQVPVSMLALRGSEALEKEILRLREASQESQQNTMKLEMQLEEALKQQNQLITQLESVTSIVMELEQTSGEQFMNIVHQDRLAARINTMEAQLEYYMDKANRDASHDDSGDETEQLKSLLAKSETEKYNYELTAKESIRRVMQEKHEVLQQLRLAQKNAKMMAEEVQQMEKSSARKSEESQRELAELKQKLQVVREQNVLLGEELAGASKGGDQVLEERVVKMLDRVENAEAMGDADAAVVTKKEVDSVAADREEGGDVFVMDNESKDEDKEGKSSNTKKETNSLPRSKHGSLRHSSTLISSSDGDFHEMAGENAEMRKKVYEQEQELETKDQKIKELSSYVTDVEDNLKETTDKLIQLGKTQQDLLVELKRSEDGARSARDEIEAMEGRLSWAQQERDQLREEVLKSGKNAQQEGELVRLRARLAEVEKELQDTKQHLTTASTSMHSLLAEKKTADDEIRRLSTALGKAHAELNVAKKELEVAVDAVRKEIKQQASSDRMELSAAVKAAEQSALVAQKNVGDMQSQLNEKQSIIEGLYMQMNSSRGEWENAQLSVSRYVEQIESMKHNLEEKHRECEDLQETVRRIQSMNTPMPHIAGKNYDEEGGLLVTSRRRHVQQEMVRLVAIFFFGFALAYFLTKLDLI